MNPPYPGDEFIPDAVMVYNHTRLIHAPPSTLWPWILQLGKSRGGWYLPTTWERFLPTSWHAARHINPAWQGLTVGSRVPDYDFGADGYFDVVAIEREKALVYQSERHGAVFTWTILLRQEEGVVGAAGGTTVHLRFRGRIASVRWKRWLIVKGGAFMDWATTAPMLAGLAERAERAHRD